MCTIFLLLFCRRSYGHKPWKFIFSFCEFWEQYCTSTNNSVTSTWGFGSLFHWPVSTVRPFFCIPSYGQNLYSYSFYEFWEQYCTSTWGFSRHSSGHQAQLCVPNFLFCKYWGPTRGTQWRGISFLQVLRTNTWYSVTWYSYVVQFCNNNWWELHCVIVNSLYQQ